MSARRIFAQPARYAAIAPYLWMVLFFLLPFGFVLKISLSQTAIAQPPYVPLFDLTEGWEAIMANTGYIEFEIAGAAVTRVDPVAWVTCSERITTAGAGGAPAVAEIAATNLFVLETTGWRIALHHASPVVRPAPAEA